MDRNNYLQHQAATEGFLDQLVEQLKAKPALLEMKDKNGKSVRDLAYEHKDSLKFLREMETHAPTALSSLQEYLGGSGPMPSKELLVTLAPKAAVAKEVEVPGQKS